MANDKATNKAATASPEELAGKLAQALEENAALKNDNDEKTRQLENAIEASEKLKADSGLAGPQSSEQVQALKEAGDLASAQLKQLQEENEKLKVTNEDLSDKLGLAKSGASKAEIFKHKGKKYQVIAGVSIPGLGKRTPLDITTDPEAQVWLVENNSGLIKEVK